MSDYKRLRELALAATPGPWEQQLDGWTVRVTQSDTDKERGWPICMTHHSGPHRVEQEVADSAFIAAANPQTILALLDALEAAQERERRLREWLDNNTTFYNVDADWPVEGQNIPVLAQVSERIWYHATDDTTSYPFSAAIDRAIAEQEERT